MGIIFLLIPQGHATPLAIVEDPTALILVNLENEDQLKELAVVVQTFYFRFDSPQGVIPFVLPADLNQQKTLHQSGFEFEVLDSDMRGKKYYQLYGTPETLRQAEAFCVFLFSVERQAVVRAAPVQAERLEKLGLMVQLLLPHPLIVPSKTDLDVDKTPSFLSAITPHPVIQQMVSQVDSITLYTYVGNLSGEWPVTVNGSPYTIYTRFTYSGVPIQKATRYAYDHFQSLGIPVEFHNYSVGGSQLRNVIAEQTGLTQPQRIFMVIAHLDSISGNPYYYAPGADDNASGSSAVMAIADILSQYNFGCTLRYALFTGEEQGYYGSSAYAHYVYQLDEDIEGVLNLDMLAYNSLATSPTLELHTRNHNSGDLAIANTFTNIVSAYSINLQPEIYQDGEAFSDHASFWNYNYSAIMAIEDWSDHTPYYHSTSDRLGTLNLSYYTEFTKAALATFAHMGCLLDSMLEGNVSNVVTSDPVPGATVKASSDGGTTYSTTTQADGNYQLFLPPDIYTVTFSATDYRTETVDDVQVNLGQTTTLDRSLQPCIAVHDVDFSFNPYRPLVGETVTLTATIGVGELPITYSWDFWDGNSGSGQQVTHAYMAKGAYSVKLTADNTCLVPTTVLHPVFVEVELIYLPFVSR